MIQDWHSHLEIKIGNFQSHFFISKLTWLTTPITMFRILKTLTSNNTTYEFASQTTCTCDSRRAEICLSYLSPIILIFTTYKFSTRNKFSDFLSFHLLYVCMLSHFSCVWLSATLWTVALQASLFVGFSRQEYWSGLPCPSPGNLPNPGLNSSLLSLLHWQAGFLPLVPSGKPKAQFTYLQNGHSNHPLEEKLWHT